MLAQSRGLLFDLLVSFVAQYLSRVWCWVSTVAQAHGGSLAALFFKGNLVVSVAPPRPPNGVTSSKEKTCPEASRTNMVKPKFPVGERSAETTKSALTYMEDRLKVLHFLLACKREEAADTLISCPFSPCRLRTRDALSSTHTTIKSTSQLDYTRLVR